MHLIKYYIVYSSFPDKELKIIANCRVDIVYESLFILFYKNKKEQTHHYLFHFPYKLFFHLHLCAYNAKRKKYTYPSTELSDTSSCAFMAIWHSSIIVNATKGCIRKIFYSHASANELDAQLKSVSHLVLQEKLTNEVFQNKLSVIILKRFKEKFKKMSFVRYFKFITYAEKFLAL